MRMKGKITSREPVAKKESSVSNTKKADTSHSINSPVEDILHLQKTVGNQAVQRLFQSGTIQAKEKTGRPVDKYEQEADRVADEVMRMPEPGVLQTSRTGNKGRSGRVNVNDIRKSIESLAKTAGLRKTIEKYLQSSWMFFKEIQRGNIWLLSTELFAGIVYFRFLSDLFLWLKGTSALDIDIFRLLKGGGETWGGVGAVFETGLESEDFRALPADTIKDLRTLEKMLIGFAKACRRRLSGPKEIFIFPRSLILEEMFEEAGEH